jgi:hypothetical protein
VTTSQRGMGRSGVAGRLCPCGHPCHRPGAAGDAVRAAAYHRPCARCHIVQPAGGTSWTDAPPFVEVAQDPKVTRAWMRDFVTKLHMHMVNTDRTQAEADALTAYLLSLRRTR